jgi:hypothetical protein
MLPRSCTTVADPPTLPTFIRRRPSLLSDAIYRVVFVSGEHVPYRE